LRRRIAPMDVRRVVMTQTQSALVEALYRVPEHGKAEITVFLEGDVADAEPAVPGWRFPVDRLE